MLDPIQINQLELYAHNQLPTAEKEALEQRMQYDKDYKQEAQAYLDIFDGFRALELDSFESEMLNWEKKHKKQPEKMETTKIYALRTFFVKYRIAAIILLLIMPLGYVAYQQSVGQVTSETLFASHFQPDEKMPVQLAPNRDVPNVDISGLTEEQIEEKKQEQEEDFLLRTTLTNGIEAYNAHEYPAAAKYLNSYLEISKNKNKNDDEIKFFVAVSQLAQGNTTEAKGIFRELAKLPANYKDGLSLTADWYMALTLLKESNIANAKKKLRKIAKTDGHPFQSESEQMLEKIKTYNIE